MAEKILVLDFGGQYNQLIARRVREQRVYAEIIRYDRITPGEIRAAGYRGIIFTGGPNSVYEEESPHYSPEILQLGIPVLVDRSSYESNPLGRMEWIKFYGELIGKTDEAKAFFDEQKAKVEGLEEFENTEKTVAFF